MCKEELVQVTQKRNFSLHHSLLGAARMAYDDAKEKRPGWAYSQLTCIALSALALEATANAFLRELFDDWQDFERSSTKAKIRIVADKLAIDIDFRKKPWNDVIWLCQLRNEIMHAKPDRVEETFVWSREKYDRHAKEPKSSLEKQITLGNAKKALSTADKVKEILCDSLPIEKQFGLRSEAWTSSATLINDND